MEKGLRTPVYNDSGLQIGDWPPFVAYPSTGLKLAGPAETWVRLTFHDPNGNSVMQRLYWSNGATGIIAALAAPAKARSRSPFPPPRD